MSSQFFEPSYVFNPCGEISLPAFKARRGWYARAKLKHFESNRESWEFAPGDLVRHISSDDAVGTIVCTKFEEAGGPC